MKAQHEKILDLFLNIPIDSGDAIFQMFSDLPCAVTGCGNKPLQRYVYIPGTRDNRIVLVAHADTVWDRAYGRQAQNTVIRKDGVYSGEDQRAGIGADDRAGCALLWALRDSGHSLLVVDGEEHGKIGAKYLRMTNRKLFRELNSHQFMIELDWRGTGGCLYNQVENSNEFKAYITQVLEFHDDMKKGGCDLQVLCDRICGVNIGVGYHNYHSPRETLVISEWENTYEKLSLFLEQDHPRFPIPFRGRVKTVLGRIKGKCRSVLRMQSKNK